MLREKWKFTLSSPISRNVSWNYGNIFQGNKVQILSELYLESVYKDAHFDQDPNQDFPFELLF